MKKNFYHLSEITPGVEKLKVHGNSKGSSTGFYVLDQYITLKSGTTIYFIGSPFSGKTEIIFELIIYCIKKYGWRVAIFSPETGTKEEILAEFISKWFMKPFYKNVHGNLSESEMYRAITELQDHLFIIDPGYYDMTVDGFYKTVDEIEKIHGRIHITVIDPWNELKHDFGRTNRQDLYLEEKLGMIRRNAQDHNRLNIVSTHITDQPLSVENNIRYYPPPTPREIAGGQSWFRKAQSLIAVWRPPFGLKDQNDIPYEENEVHLIIQKYKPKGVGKRGTAKLYFSTEANRYYELNENGTKHFPGANL